MRTIRGAPLLLSGVVFLASAAFLGASVWDALRLDSVEESGSAAWAPEGAVLAQEEAPGTALAAAASRPAEETPRSDPARAASGSQEAVVRSEDSRAVVGSEGARAMWYPRVTNEEILEAVNQDLFRPDRLPPPERYRFPSERAALSQPARNDRRRREPELRVVGAALTGDLALALVQVGDSVPLALLVGESVEGYTLAAVDEESATLTRDEEVLTLPVVEPFRNAERSAGRAGRAGSQQLSADQVRALQQRVQQMLQGMRGQFIRGGEGIIQLRGRGGGTDAVLMPNVTLERVPNSTRPAGGRGGRGG